MPGSLALGFDTVSVTRIELALLRGGERFLTRVFTPLELAADRSAGFLASRFAAKEAFFKALGTGLTGGVSWLDLEVPPGGGSPPRPRVSGRSLELLAGREVMASISRTARTAVAVVLLAPTEGG